MVSKKIIYSAIAVGVILALIAGSYAVLQSSQFYVPTSAQLGAVLGNGTYSLCVNTACSASSGVPLSANRTNSTERTGPAKSTPADRVVRISLLAMVMFNSTSGNTTNTFSESVSNINGNTTLGYSRASAYLVPRGAVSTNAFNVTIYNGTQQGMTYSVVVINSVTGASSTMSMVAYKDNRLASINVGSSKSFLNGQTQSSLIRMVANSIG